MIINRAIEEWILLSLRFQRSLKFDSSRDEWCNLFCYRAIFEEWWNDALFFFFGMDRSVFDKNSIQRKYFKNIKLSGKNFQVLDYLKRFYIFVDTINNELNMNFQGRFRITEILRQLQKLSFP